MASELDCPSHILHDGHGFHIRDIKLHEFDRTCNKRTPKATHC